MLSVRLIIDTLADNNRRIERETVLLWTSIVIHWPPVDSSQDNGATDGR